MINKRDQHPFDTISLMSKTLVIQSHRTPLLYPWIESCLASVRDWCALNGYEYRYMGEELFDAVPDVLLEKTRQQRVIASDLARLLVLQEALSSGYEAAIWLDADFLIFNPTEFVLSESPYSVGREVWVQHDKHSGLKVYKKVHNAFLLFRQGNPFLDYYADAAQRVLLLNEGTMPPQFIGPKLLTALDNIAKLPVMETAGMLSPMVVKDILEGGGTALNLFVENSPKPIAGANLCISSCERKEVSHKELGQLIEMLKSKKGW